MPDTQLSDQSTSPSSPDLPPLGELTELEDGSAIVELDSDPVASSDETDFSANLAESLSEFELNTISTNLLELIEKDKKLAAEIFAKSSKVKVDAAEVQQMIDRIRRGETQ